MRIGILGLGRIGRLHAQTLLLDERVDALLLADALPQAAAAAAEELGERAAASSLDALLGEVDAVVVASSTDSHGSLIMAGVEAGLPTFCEKPIAATLAESIEVGHRVQQSGALVQVGFQRRFDVGYRRLESACATGELGTVHTIRANTLDSSPPPAAYIPSSGGIFRDCSIHDFDALRFVTGQEVVEAYAVGGTTGAAYIAEAGDVDTGAAVLTLSGGAVATVHASRHNGAGHDVRMEVLGSLGGLSAGLDGRLPTRSAEEGVSFPDGEPAGSFVERFAAAYPAELRAFVDLVCEGGEPACTVQDAVEAARIAEAATLSRLERRPVALAELDGLPR